jgi:DNA-binding CsgD family transcriptional regulator
VLLLVVLLGVTWGVFFGLLGGGLVAGLLRDYRVARAYLERSLDAAREIDDTVSVGNALYNLGNLAHEQADAGPARALLEEALSLFEQLGDVRVIGNGCQALAIVALDTGDLPSAERYFNRALALYREAGDRRMTTLPLANLGSLAAAQGDLPLAHQRLSESLRIQQELGDPGGIAFVLERYAGLAARKGYAARALRLGGAAAALRAQAGTPLSADAEEKLAGTLAPAHQTLGVDAAAQEMAAGRSLSSALAIEYALSREASAPSATAPIPPALPDGRTDVLSPREREVAALIARGHTNRRIAEELVVTEGTVASHVVHMLDKLRFSSRTQIASWATEHGLRRDDVRDVEWSRERRTPG